MKKDLSNIKKSKYFLDKNHCVGIPTETVYGLAANAYSNIATAKIYKLKKRPILYKYFCPGPITFILKLKKNHNISKNVTNGKSTLAVRFPKNNLTRKLLSILKYPLAAPSANISSRISPVSKKDVKEEFGRKIRFILDGGKSEIGLESTIISLIDKPKILRLGGIERSKINKILNKKVKYFSAYKKITVPGQSKLHYSPGIPIRLNATKPRIDEAFILIKKRNKTFKNYYYLSKTKNLKNAAKNLYKTLRIIKKKKYKKISVEKIPNIGFGEAINDRLKRAAAK
jgi:L-threonylcarbamoyladenylate synthase